MIRLQINAVPIAQARPRMQARGRDGKPLPFVRTYDPARSKDWKALCRMIIIQQLREKYPNFVIHDEPLEVNMLFILPRPQAKAMRKLYFRATKPDLENLEKGVLDSMEGLVYTNDSRVVKKTTEKIYQSEVYRVGVKIQINEVDKYHSIVVSDEDWQRDWSKRDAR